MAKKAKIEFNKDLEQQLRDLPAVVDDIAARTKAIADACNADSSWDDPKVGGGYFHHCLLYTSPSPRDRTRSRMPSSA